MLISKRWLQNFFSSPLPSVEELGSAITFHAFEIDGIEKKGDDEVLDIKVTPNRGHDALSHRGIAGEVSAILNLPLKKELDPLGPGFASRFAQAPKTNVVSISLQDKTLSPRYIAGYIKGVKVGPSPEWLKQSLAAIGQRSINNVVDATNLVMFNLGQPLHAFDAGKLTQKDGKFAIAVRLAQAGEKLVALDSKEYVLQESMLVIADANQNVPIGIAGIKGGTPASITEATQDIIIESANFSGVAVRKAARALKLRTDASTRFEQAISPELAHFGMQNVVELILTIAGGGLVGYHDEYPEPAQQTRVSVSLEKINRVLGTQLTGADVAEVFLRLGFGYREEKGVFEIAVPFERLDLVIEEDIIEEVVRIIGYDKISATPLPPLNTVPQTNSLFYTAERTREELVQKGYSEVFTSVFAEAGERAVLNKVDSVKPFLRTTLIKGLEETLKKNIPNRDLLGLKEVKLFEIGVVWKGGKEVWMLGTIGEKEKAKETPLNLGVAEHYDNLPLSTAKQFVPFSKYPYIVRDIAVWTPASSNKKEVSEMTEKIIQKEAGELAHAISLFDRFEKGDKLSLGFRIIFQSFERTLTEDEVNISMQKVSAALTRAGFEIR